MSLKRDIKNYDWEAHTIELTDEFISQKRQVIDKTNTYGGSKVLGAKDDDKFVLVVNGERIYSGGFNLALFRSQSPSLIRIIDISNNKINVDVNKLSSFSMNDPRIYKVLKDYGKLNTN